MKKTIKRISALAIGALVLAGSPMAAWAAEGSYTYNYDWWGDFQDSPDAYSICNVYTSADFGLETNLKTRTACLS